MKRLKGLLAMVLAAAIALTALPLTASAVIHGDIVIFSEFAGSSTIAPTDVVEGDDGVYKFSDEALTNSYLNGNLTAYNLWVIYGNYYDGASFLKTVSGNNFADLIHYDHEDWYGYSNYNAKPYHTVAITTKDLSDDTVTNADLKNFTVSYFPFDLRSTVDLSLLLDESSTWTAWFKGDSELQNSSCNYNSGNCIPTVSEPQPITTKLSADIVKRGYDSVGNSDDCSYSFYSGKTIIQIDAKYKTFDIPVYTGIGQAEKNGEEQKTIAVTANDDKALDEGCSFYLVYGTQLIDKSNTERTYSTVSEVWDKIGELAEANDYIDGSKLKLIRDVTVSVNSNAEDYYGVISSYDYAAWMLGNAAKPAAFEYLLNAEPQGTWRIIPEHKQGYKQKFVYQSGLFDELADYLQDNPTENNISLYEIDHIYVTGDPDNSMEIGGSLPHEYFCSSPMLVIDPTDEENQTNIQAKISDHAAVLQLFEPAGAGYTYDLNDWQLWGGTILYGDVMDLEKADISSVERTESLNFEQLEKVSTSNDVLLIYFPQVAIAPDVLVQVPDVGMAPTPYYNTVDKIGGYTITDVSWYDGDTLLTKTDVFEAGKQYTVKITLTAPNGFLSTTPVTINYEKASAELDENGELIASLNIICSVPKPENVKAAAGSGQVTLTWDAVEGATGYRVLMNNGSGWKGTTVGNVTTYTATGLTGGTAYRFVVKAIAGSTFSADSDIVTATPFVAAPQNLKATAGTGKVTLTWDAVMGAEGYRVLMNGGSGWKGTTVGDVTTYTATGLTGGTTYKFVVKAIFGGTFGADSETVSATPVAAAPQNFKAAAGNGKVTLTWSAVEGAAGYRILMNNGSGWKGTTVGNVTSYTATGLTGGTTYKFVVKAIFGGTFGADSETVSATPFVAAPQNLKATAGTGKVTLTWDAVEGAEGYRVLMNGGSGWKGITVGNVTSYTATGLTGGTTYKFVVKAIFGGTFGADSETVSATPVAAAPQNFKATAGNGKVTLTWSAVEGAAGYRVLMNNGSGWKGTTVGNVTSYTATGLTNGKVYKFVVKAIVGGVYGSDSAQVVAAPLAITATKGTKSIDLSWNAVTGATGYRVLVNDGSGWKGVNVTNTTYALSGLTTGKTYKIVIKAVVNGAFTADSETTTIAL